MAKTHSFYDVAIIGSGLAGCAAARVLAGSGLSYAIFDKGRRIGGRVSTKRADGFLFNHGAQFITAKSSLFKTAIRQAEARGILEKWQENHTHIRYSGTPDMRGFLEMLGEGHDIHQTQEIQQITQNTKGLTLIFKDASEVAAQHILITAPAPQTAKLVRGISKAASDIAQSTQYHPCWTVMLGYSNPPSTLARQMQNITLLSGGDIAALSSEQSRPDAEKTHIALTIQANEAFSAAQLEKTPEQIIHMLKTNAEAILGQTLPTADFQAAHRWRYAKVATPTTPDDARIFRLTDRQSHLALAGDWIPVPATDRPADGTRAEEAYLSGASTATALLNAIQQR